MSEATPDIHNLADEPGPRQPTPPADAPTGLDAPSNLDQGKASRTSLEKPESKTVTPIQASEEKLEEVPITRNSLGQVASEKKSLIRINDSSQGNLAQSKRASQINISSMSHISLGGRINRTRDEIYQDQQVELGYNELLAMTPEAWKNIAPPVIAAVKQLIKTGDKTHLRLFETQMLLEETGQRLHANTTRLNKELQTNSDRFDGAIRLVE
jgi:hypothetical protein